LGTAIALSIGAIIMIFIARSYGVLIHRFPVAGGEFTYAYVGFKRKHAFFAAWMLGLSYLSIVPLNATDLGSDQSLHVSRCHSSRLSFIPSLVGMSIWVKSLYRV